MGPSTLLPLAARERLIKATQIKDPFERLKAIDAAIDRVKSEHPKLFKPETENLKLLKENK